MYLECPHQSLGVSRFGCPSPIGPHGHHIRCKDAPPHFFGEHFVTLTLESRTLKYWQKAAIVIMVICAGRTGPLL